MGRAREKEKKPTSSFLQLVALNMRREQATDFELGTDIVVIGGVKVSRRMGAGMTCRVNCRVMEVLMVSAVGS